MEQIQGVVDRITYHNEDNGYSVIRLMYNGESMVCVGFVMSVHEGDYIVAEGQYKIHPQYGPQFSAKNIVTGLPRDERIYEEYLSSKAIKGIGPVLAHRIIDAFGSDAIRMIEEDPETVAAEVKGISRKAARDLRDQLIEKKEILEHELFFVNYGVSNTIAKQIINTYGLQEGKSIIQNNPYQMISEIKGIGFRKADEIAQKGNIPKNSVFRIRSGIVFALDEKATMEGHTYFPEDLFVEHAVEMLQVEKEEVEKEINSLVLSGKLIRNRIDDKDVLYLPVYFHMERRVAEKLAELMEADNQEMSLEECIAAVKQAEKEVGAVLDDTQREAVITAAKNGVLIITGGPGTGKTTTLKVLLHYFENQGEEVVLAAPTGRAAKRMAESTGKEASTIHRLLGIPLDEADEIDADVIVIDETSMVDISLMYMLTKAIVPGTKLVLVGDVDQLPSVGPGSVLKDIIHSEKFPVARLTKIHRQSGNSHIIVNAHRINKGLPIDLSHSYEDFFSLKREEARDILNVVKILIADKLPKHFNCSPFDIQVLSPMKPGELGIENMNRVLQEFLNPPSDNKRECKIGMSLFREGDKVMHIKNNYNLMWYQYDENWKICSQGKGVFNGDCGRIYKIDNKRQQMLVLFEDGKMSAYSFDEVGELTLSYAITIHKSQGSEYPVVILPLLKGGAPMLFNRSLLYTAVTRAQKCVVHVGNGKVIQTMIHNNKSRKRYTSIQERLQEIFAISGK